MAVNRRDFLAGMAACALMPQLFADSLRLGPPTANGTPVRVWVDNPALVLQSCPLFCWAASISMLFATYDYQVDQVDIVQRVFGNPRCQPSGNPRTIGNALSVGWTDQGGSTFHSRVTAAYDAINGINVLNNQMIAEELANNHPLIYCNKHHCMMLVSMELMETPNGPSAIGNVGVFDPWPPTAGFHYLSEAEKVPLNLGGEMTFVARVKIQ
ncbi:hypothetical protein [Silvimonas soli]|uniref:hypothetical protein n=1 Tax=Silvimonas soli TaxID=2980100 RepID=UPI0024B3C016|nr:hypothetical protein [Silvimonas soli]